MVTQGSPEDRDLGCATAAGSVEVFEGLVERYCNTVYAIAYARLKRLFRPVEKCGGFAFGSGDWHVAGPYQEEGAESRQCSLARVCTARSADGLYRRENRR